MSQSPPNTLGQYQIIREIARSNDIVYEAYDPLMNRRVAVKELAVPAGTTGQQREDRISRFKREAQAAGTLNHPNIMTVYSFAEDAGRIFMALEYLDGNTLRNELDTKGAMKLERAVEIVTQVLTGLGHAHTKGVIHRDIKPDNIQILSNGTVKITDFGIARLTFQPNLTMDGQVFGTPSYMSPEQVVGREIDARRDLFSVGVMFYEMLAGSKPFGGDSVVSITYAIMNNEPAPPQGVSGSIWEVIRKALDKTSQLRYGSAEEFIEAIKNATTQTALGLSGPPPSQQFSPSAQAFNPYAPGAGYNPQAGFGQAPPPPVYTFNPYQPGQQVPQGYPMNQPYAPPQHHVPTMQPPNGLPIYYPPPPRQPMMSPETAAFMKKFSMFFVLIGTFLAVIVFSMSAISKSITDAGARQQDAQIENKIISGDTRVPVEERINEAERNFGRLQTGDSRTRVGKNLAVLYEQLGKKNIDLNGGMESAESSFLKAISLDPKNPAFAADLGDLYARRARLTQDPTALAQIWQQSGTNWKLAAENTPDLKAAAPFREAGAYAFYYAANAIFSTGDRTSARRLLYDARSLAPAGSQIEQQILTGMTQLGN